MSRLGTGIYVGDLYRSNKLFDGTSNGCLSKDVVENPESPERIKGVITACFDVPDWCCQAPGNLNKVANVDNELYNLISKSTNFDQSYINLHVDCIPQIRRRSSSRSSVKEDENTYLIHAVIQAEDGPNECLFRAFGFTFDFVEAVRAVGKGSTYIHCMMGMSRSCTLVSAYLMKRKNQPYTAVIKHIKAHHPIASPSLGFICQLILYRKHGYKIDNINQFCSEYRSMLHNTNLQNIEDCESGKLPSCSKSNDDAVYSCMKCRQTLFYGSNVLQHDNPATGKGGSVEPCSSVFVEPMDWMSDVNTQSGKIMCKNNRCASKLGYYCWYGRRCSCGYLQVPAFQIRLSKVDRLVTESTLGGSTPVRNEDLI